jgi:hypothetical protein
LAAVDDVQAACGVWILIFEQYFYDESGQFVNLAAARAW